MAKGKRRSPKEVIESTGNPNIEHTFITPAGSETIDFTNYNKASHISTNITQKDKEKIAEYVQGRQYRDIHTHPSKLKHSLLHWAYNTVTLPLSLLVFNHNSFYWPWQSSNVNKIAATPSSSDISIFLKKSNLRSRVIATRNPESGEVLGFTVLKKTEDTKYPYEEIDPDLSKYEDSRIKAIRKNNPLIASQGLKKISKNFNFKYKMIPCEGYKINDSKTAFVESNNHLDLEEKVNKTAISSTIAITALILSLFFLSPTLTGNAVANLTTKTSSIIGAGLFIIGIVGSYFWFKKK